MRLGRTWVAPGFCEGSFPGLHSELKRALPSGFRQCLDKHINNPVNRFLLAVAQGSVLTHFDHADTRISEKHPKELGSLFKGKSLCMREVRGRQIAASEYVDIEMKQDGSGSRRGCKNLERQLSWSNAANVGEREGVYTCLLRLRASSPTDLRDLRRLEH
jgi:hypothetical protein